MQRQFKGRREDACRSHLLALFFFMKTLLISIFSKQGKGKKGKKKGKRGKKDKDLTADR